MMNGLLYILIMLVVILIASGIIIYCTHKIGH